MYMCMYVYICMYMHTYIHPSQLQLVFYRTRQNLNYFFVMIITVKLERYRLDVRDPCNRWRCL